MTIGIVAVINFFSAFVQASSGFGYAIFAMFFMPMIIPFQQCSVISAATIIVIGIQMTISLRKHLNIKKIILPMTFCLMTTWLGVYIINVTDVNTMKIVMGIFLVFLSLYFYITTKYEIKLKRGLIQGTIIGLLTGITTGMFNIVGPLLMLYYYDNSKDSLEFKANIEGSFLIAGLYSLCLNLFYVKLDIFLIKAIFASAAGAILEGIIGLKVFKKIDKIKLKYIIIGILPLMGLILIVK